MKTLVLSHIRPYRQISPVALSKLIENPLALPSKARTQAAHLLIALHCARFDS